MAKMTNMTNDDAMTQIATSNGTDGENDEKNDKTNGKKNDKPALAATTAKMAVPPVDNPNGARNDNEGEGEKLGESLERETIFLPEKIEERPSQNKCNFALKTENEEMAGDDEEQINGVDEIDGDSFIVIVNASDNIESNNGSTNTSSNTHTSDTSDVSDTIDDKTDVSDLAETTLGNNLENSLEKNLENDQHYERDNLHELPDHGDELDQHDQLNQYDQHDQHDQHDSKNLQHAHHAQHAQHAQKDQNEPTSFDRMAFHRLQMERRHMQTQMQPQMHFEKIHPYRKNDDIHPSGGSGGSSNSSNSSSRQYGDSLGNPSTPGSPGNRSSIEPLTTMPNATNATNAIYTSSDTTRPQAANAINAKNAKNTTIESDSQNSYYNFSWHSNDNRQFRHFQDPNVIETMIQQSARQKLFRMGKRHEDSRRRKGHGLGQSPGQGQMQGLGQDLGRWHGQVQGKMQGQMQRQTGREQNRQADGSNNNAVNYSSDDHGALHPHPHSPNSPSSSWDAETQLAFLYHQTHPPHGAYPPLSSRENVSLDERVDELHWRNNEHAENSYVPMTTSSGPSPLLGHSTPCATYSPNVTGNEAKFDNHDMDSPCRSGNRSQHTANSPECSHLPPTNYLLQLEQLAREKVSVPSTSNTPAEAMAGTTVSTAASRTKIKEQRERFEDAYDNFHDVIEGVEDEVSSYSTSYSSPAPNLQAASASSACDSHDATHVTHATHGSQMSLDRGGHGRQVHAAEHEHHVGQNNMNEKNQSMEGCGANDSLSLCMGSLVTEEMAEAMPPSSCHSTAKRSLDGLSPQWNGEQQCQGEQIHHVCQHDERSNSNSVGPVPQEISHPDTVQTRSKGTYLGGWKLALIVMAVLVISCTIFFLRPQDPTPPGFNLSNLIHSFSQIPLRLNQISFTVSEFLQRSKTKLIESIGIVHTLRTKYGLITSELNELDYSSLGLGLIYRVQKLKWDMAYLLTRAKVHIVTVNDNILITMNVTLSMAVSWWHSSGDLDDASSDGTTQSNSTACHSFHAAERIIWKSTVTAAVCCSNHSDPEVDDASLNSMQLHADLNQTLTLVTQNDMRHAQPSHNPFWKAGDKMNSYPFLKMDVPSLKQKYTHRYIISSIPNGPTDSLAPRDSSESRTVRSLHSLNRLNFLHDSYHTFHPLEQIHSEHHNPTQLVHPIIGMGSASLTVGKLRMERGFSSLIVGDRPFASMISLRLFRELQSLQIIPPSHSRKIKHRDIIFSDTKSYERVDDMPSLDDSMRQEQKAGGKREIGEDREQNRNRNKPAYQPRDYYNPPSNSVILHQSEQIDGDDIFAGVNIMDMASEMIGGFMSKRKKSENHRGRLFQRKKRVSRR